MATIPSTIGDGGRILMTGDFKAPSPETIFKEIAQDLEAIRAALGSPATLDFQEADVPADLGHGGIGLHPGFDGSYKKLLDSIQTSIDALNEEHELGLTLNLGATNVASDFGAGGKVLPSGRTGSFKDLLFKIVDDLNAIVAEDIPAQITTEVDLTGGIDMTTNFNVKIEIDNGGATTVDLSSGAGDASAVTRTEIIANLDSALGASATVEAVAGSGGEEFIKITSATKGATSEIEFTAPATNDVTDAAFGTTYGVTATYPNTFNGQDASSVYSGVTLKSIKG